MTGARHFGFYDNFGFALVAKVRFEGLAFYFSDHDFSFALVD
jgi:hypothetical protein